MPGVGGRAVTGAVPLEGRSAVWPDRLLCDALDALPDAVCITEFVGGRASWPGVVVHANRTFCGLWGDPVGCDWMQLWPDALHANDTSVRDELVAGRPARERLGRSGEKDTYFEITVRSIDSGSGGDRFNVTLVRDVTTEQAAREQLGREHDQLRESQALAGLGTWEWDIGFDLVRWSDQLYEIFGLDPERFEATYAAYLERVHPDDRPLAMACVSRCLETHEPFASDYRVVLPDGEVRWLHSRGRVQLDGAGAPVQLRGVCQDITERKELEDGLLHQSLHDPLTGLPNRFLLQDRVELALGRARREQRSVAVCFLDLDHFKRVNDEKGHAAGDEVLREVAARLRRVVRPSDTVARVGGDEFVVVADDASTAAQAIDIGTRLTEALRLSVPVGGGTQSVTASVGVVLAQPDDDPSTVLFNADQAMYRAKRLGRDQAVFDDTAA